jgi:hypothetical protein
VLIIVSQADLSAYPSGETYIGSVSSAEVENLASLVDSIGVLTGLIERLLDEPPQPPAGVSSNIAVQQPIKPADPALVRYSVKVGLCVVGGFTAGVITHRADLFTILITVLMQISTSAVKLEDRFAVQAKLKLSRYSLAGTAGCPTAMVQL